jgi:hypothetical protein
MKVVQKLYLADHQRRLLFDPLESRASNGHGMNPCGPMRSRAEIITDEEAVYGVRLLTGKYKP